MIAWFAGQPLVFKIVLGGLSSLLLLFLLWLLWLRKYLEWQNVKSLDIKERVGLKIEFIKTAAQILGGAFFLVTIYVAWANLVVSQEKHKTDLFTKAIEQLGNDKQIEVRLGGIYALERIARDSQKDHGPIMEVLTAFVRLHAPWPPENPAAAQEASLSSIAPGADIQAILTVIGRLGPAYGENDKPHVLDLRKTCMQRTNLQKAHMEGANLWGAHLEWADLREAHLEGADLSGASLHRADLLGAHLESVYLLNARIERADLRKAHLEGAKLGGANLEGADLTGALGLTKEQIDSAFNVDKNKLPHYLKPTDPGKAKPQ